MAAPVGAVARSAQVAEIVALPDLVQDCIVARIARTIDNGAFPHEDNAVGAGKNTGL